MSIIKINRTSVRPNISDSEYNGDFKVTNEYLQTFFFPHDHPIWMELSSAYAQVTEKIINSHLPEILNKDALEKLKIREKKMKL